MRYGGYKYDDDSGEFEEIPGAKRNKSRPTSRSWHLPRLRMPSFHLPRPRFRMPRLDWKSVWRCLEKPLYYFFYPVVKWWQVELEAARDREWFMVLLWLFPGLFLLGVYRVVFALLLGLMGGALTSVHIDDSMTLLLVIGGLIASVVLYAKALTMARRGQLVVYRDWGDFMKSAAWIIAVPLGLEWGLDTDCDWLVRMAGWALVLVGVCCFLWMILGAFFYNSGSRCWLALFGRFAVTFLLLFALAELNEKFQQYKRHELGAIRGVLIPLAVFAVVFNWLVRPMIHTERRRW